VRIGVFMLLAWAAHAQPRTPAPDPSRGERYDGRVDGDRSAARGALWVPRVILFPFRLLVWGAEPATRQGVEFEERHHLYTHLYQALTSDDGQIGIRPTWKWVSSFRPIFGAHVFDDKLFGPGTKADFDIAGGVDVVETAIRLRPTRVGAPFGAFLDARYSHRNDWLFTGIGSHSPPPLTGRYLQDKLDLGPRFDLRPAPVLAFSFGGFFGLRHFADGEGYDNDVPISQSFCKGGCSDAVVPGFNNGTRFVRTSAGIHLDLRDDLIRPTLGALINIEADYTHGVIDDDSSYFRLREEAAVVFSLWQHSHLVLLRGATEIVLPVSEALVPFSELATLGGPEDLRGFRVGSFRGFSMLLATAEYRFPILAWVDTALFVDYGGVFDKNYSGFGASRMQADLGFGFRVHTRDRFYLRMQFAYGFDGGGWQIYLTGHNLP
jgi:Omp85 superfamily domain